MVAYRRLLSNFAIVVSLSFVVLWVQTSNISYLTIYESDFDSPRTLQGNRITEATRNETLTTARPGNSSTSTVSKATHHQTIEELPGITETRQGNNQSDSPSHSKPLAMKMLPSNSASNATQRTSHGDDLTYLSESKEPKIPGVELEEGPTNSASKAGQKTNAPIASHISPSPSDIYTTSPGSKETYGQMKNNLKETTIPRKESHKNATIRAVAYSLYGDDTRYWRGMANVAKQTPSVFPHWQVWIYHDNTVPQKALKQLNKLPHVKLINVVTDLPPWVHNQTNPMTWRFWVATDPTIDAFAIRDADALPSAREFAALQEFLSSGKALHILRDHPMHNPTEFAPILGGLWGGRGDSLPHMDQLLKEYYALPPNQKQRKRYGEDQDFLWRIVLPLLSNNVLQHDSYYCREANAIAFPVARENSPADNNHPFWYVGNTFAQKNRVGMGSQGILRKAAKRYQACLQDRQQLETILQQQQGISREFFARHVNTTFALKLRRSPTEAFREWSTRGNPMNNTLYERDLDVSSYIAKG